MRLWLINAAFSLCLTLFGGLIGWWIRGHFQTSTVKRQERLIRDGINGLRNCTSKIRGRILEHTRELERIEKRLGFASTPSNADVTSAASDLVIANATVRQELAEIENRLQIEVEVLGRSFTEENHNVLTLKSLDRKERLYKKVRRNLEFVANNLAADLCEHRTAFDEIGNTLSDSGAQTSDSRIAAVSQIMDATSRMWQLIGRAEQRIEAQAARIEKHAKQAATDELTRLANRRRFDRELQRLHDEYQSSGKTYSLIMIDVDHFKRINDRYGHQAGDAVLKELGGTFKYVVRENDLPARYGGEEFAILLPDTSLFDAKVIAERTRRACAETVVETDGTAHRVTVSVGVSAAMPDRLAQEIVEYADQALYAAKEAGRDCTYWHDGTRCIAVASAQTNTAKQMAFQPKPVGEPTSEAVADTETSPPPSATAPALELSCRSAFCRNVYRRVAEWQRGGPPISVLLMRIDQTEEISDSHGDDGHAKLMVVLSHLLAALTRSMDECCEYDAESIAVLAPGTTALSAVKIGERLRVGVSECQMRLDQKRYNFTASVGVAHTDGGDSGVDVMQRGEVALQTAIECGGDATYFADRAGESPASRRLPFPE